MFAARSKCLGDGRRFGCIAERNGNVPKPALVADAPDGRALGLAQEFLLVPSKQLDECRAVERMAWGEEWA